MLSTCLNLQYIIIVTPLTIHCCIEYLAQEKRFKESSKEYKSIKFNAQINKIITNLLSLTSDVVQE